MAKEERLPDDAVVVRCGLPPFVDSPLERGCRRHPVGLFGFSVQAAVGLTVEQLATACRNKSVGFTSVAQIRIMGYEVVRTSGEAITRRLSSPRIGAPTPRKNSLASSGPRPTRHPRSDNDDEDDLRGLQCGDRGRIPLPHDARCSGRYRTAGRPTRRLGLAQRQRGVRRRQLAIDDYYGLVGVPDWDTLVHLDDEGADDFDRVRDELNPLLTKKSASSNGRATGLSAPDTT